VIEEKAKLYRDMVRVIRLYEDCINPFWPEEAKIEMNTRVLVQRDFSDLLGNNLPRTDLEALERVLFSVVYPSLGFYVQDLRFAV